MMTIVVLLIIVCHVYTYTSLFSKVKTKLGTKMDRLFSATDPKPKPRQCHYSPPPDDDIHCFDELLDELDCHVNTDEYNTVPLLGPPPVESTFSVVELPKPRNLAAPDPEEVQANMQCIPDAEIEMKELTAL